MATTAAAVSDPAQLRAFHNQLTFGLVQTLGMPSAQRFMRGIFFFFLEQGCCSCFVVRDNANFPRTHMLTTAQEKRPGISEVRSKPRAPAGPSAAVWEQVRGGEW
jgi:hypothetical protein